MALSYIATDPSSFLEDDNMEILRLNPKKPGTVTILDGPLPFIIGGSQLWEDHMTGELWKRKLNNVTGNHGKWENTGIIANDFR